MFRTIKDTITGSHVATVEVEVNRICCDAWRRVQYGAHILWIYWEIGTIDEESIVVVNAGPPSMFTAGVL